MLASPALADWFGDPNAQRATVNRLQQVAERLRSAAAFANLDAALAAADSTNAASILAAAAAWLERGEGIEAWMGELIAAAGDDPFARPPLRNTANEVLTGLWVVERPLLSIMVALVPADGLAAKRTGRTGRASIAFTGQRSVYRILRSGGATVSFWDAPEIGTGFRTETGGRCRLVERRRIEDGEVIEIDGRSCGFVIDHAVSDIVYAQAMTPVGAAPLMAEYDADSCECVGASSADEASSRIELMLALLRTMERADAAPVFEAVLASAPFHLRWQAMREFLALDADAALPHLRRMAAGDPHPEVRAAAAETLRHFFEETAADEERIPCHA